VKLVDLVADVVIEWDCQPIAVNKAPQGHGRSIDECIALARGDCGIGSDYN
jgi:hypothetical protein